MEESMTGRYSLNLPVDLKQEAEQVAQQQGVSLNQLILWSLTEKVTSLKGKLDDPNYPSITYKLDTENELVPIIRSKGIRVQTIVIASQVWKESEAEIAKQYDLPPSVVKETLSFYLAHKTAVDALINENNVLAAEHV
jgi:uncharacterized protein (DUF433 family)